MRLVASVLLSLVTIASPAAAETRVSDITETLIEHHIRPSYERLYAELELLGFAVEDACAMPDPVTLAAARSSFGDALIAWSRIAHIRFGPAARENRYERMHFWPDRRSLGLRQVQRVLATANPAMLDPDELRQQSVALRGFGALEFVLFGTGSDALADPQTEPFRCRYGAAVVGAMIETVGEIDRDWSDKDGFGRLLREPGPDNPLYRDEREVLAEYVGTLAHAFEAIRDQKLKPVLGASAEAAKPKLAVFRRSGLGREAIRAEFAGLSQMLEITGLANILPADKRWMGGSALFEFRNIERTLNGIAPDIGQEAESIDGWGRLNYLVIVSRGLQRLIGEDMAAGLGLSVGFSALDGD